MDKCPHCEREFKGFRDYPLIYIAKFERIALPSDLKIPLDNEEGFHSYQTGEGRTKAPQEVVDFFKIPANAKKEFAFGNFRWKKKWNIRDYSQYTRSSDDIMWLVLEKINPYFENLERLVGKEVEPKDIFPPFSVCTRYGGFRFGVPDTDNYLEFKKEVSEGNKRILGLKIIQHIPGITACDIDYIDLADIARIEYEGRFRNKAS